MGGPPQGTILILAFGDAVHPILEVNPCLSALIIGERMFGHC
jgi:hypothetical protein